MIVLPCSFYLVVFQVWLPKDARVREAGNISKSDAFYWMRVVSKTGKNQTSTNLSR